MINKFLYPNGGSETYIFKLGDYLKSQGHEVQYFGMEHEGRIVGNRANAYTTNMDFHNASKLAKVTYPLKTIYSSEARKKLRLVLEDFKPNVVHLNNINFQLTPSIIYEVKKNKIPIVQTVHDVQIACPNHRCYIEHNHTICDKCDSGNYYECVKNKCLDNSTLKSLIACVESYFYHIRNTYNLIDVYICPSEFMKKKIIIGGVKKEKVEVLYNFSDKIDFVKPDPSTERYCLYFGRLSKEKGIDTLLDVFTQLSNIKIKIAGKGPLENKVQKYSEIYDNIEFLGYRSGCELTDVITKAEFSFCCSEWYENCPLSVVESQALGTPVIGSDLGGTKELIKQGETGIIFKGCDRQAFLKAIVSLWNDTEQIKKMSQNCINMKRNTIDIYANKLMKCYKSLY